MAGDGPSYPEKLPFLVSAKNGRRCPHTLEIRDFLYVKEKLGLYLVIFTISICVFLLRSETHPCASEDSAT